MRRAEKSPTHSTEDGAAAEGAAAALKGPVMACHLAPVIDLIRCFNTSVRLMRPAVGIVYELFITHGTQ